MLPNILCDGNIPNAIVASLKKWGFYVEQVTPGESDQTIALRAKERKQIILTFDSDFANVLAYPPREYFGIIRIKIKPPLADIIIDSLSKLFKHFKKRQAFQGKLIILESNTFRIWEETR